MRVRRPPRERRPEISEAEELWARGELTEDHPEYGDVVFFTSPARLRAVWHAVNGSPLWHGLPDETRPGRVLVHGADVGLLSAEGVRLLRLGIDPWEDR